MVMRSIIRAIGRSTERWRRIGAIDRAIECTSEPTENDYKLITAKAHQHPKEPTKPQQNAQLQQKVDGNRQKAHGNPKTHEHQRKPTERHGKTLRSHRAGQNSPNHAKNHKKQQKITEYDTTQTHENPLKRRKSTQNKGSHRTYLELIYTRAFHGS